MQDAEIEVVVDVDAAGEVSDIVRNLNIIRDSYRDERFYPPIDAPRDLQLGYFFTMVAIDHRTSGPWGDYSDTVNGETLRGADLLYWRGARLFRRDSTFFTPERLSAASVEEVRELLGDVWDFWTRLLLIRDLGEKAREMGGFEALLDSSIQAFAAKLRRLRAFEDPVRKKIMLLAKFLDGRGLANFTDLSNADIPVDNHITRIALRLGLVKLRGTLYDKLVRGLEFTSGEDVVVRRRVALAWKIVSEYSGIHVFALDDYLWRFARTVCTPNNPKCEVCPFNKVCRNRDIREHKFVITWWY